MREKELILYTDFAEEEGALLYDMAWLMDHYADEFYNVEDKSALCFECLHKLLAMTGNYGFYGNLWHCYLTNLLVNHENSYSLGCELKGEMQGTMNRAALHDIEIFQEFFSYDFTQMLKTLHGEAMELAFSFAGSQEKSKAYNSRIRDQICDLAMELGNHKTPEEMKMILTGFYQKYGVGKLGLHKSFRVAHDENGVHIVPIRNIAHVKFEDLVGCEIQKKKIIDNTDAFVEGRKANNCLLFGDAGTGKSSSIKALTNAYYEKGIRVIEIYKHQFQDLNEVIAQIKNRNYHFIIYMDDLSFEEFEIEYKYLKAVIEGGLEKKPDNVLIYATSNRRHLIRETFRDKADRIDDEDMHSNDTVQEKLSLVARFGVTVYFGSPDKKEFQKIVKALADRNHIVMPEEELLLEANKWELSHGGLSGRTAQQFVDYLLGQQKG